MPINAVSLGRFYQTSLGRQLARALEKGIARYKPPSKSDSVLGFGYTAPYLSRFAEQAAHCSAFMPAAIAPAAEESRASAVKAGAAKTDAAKTGAAKASAEPRAKQRHNAAGSAEELGAERRFPLRDNSIDCVLAVHALEFCPHAPAQLAELWRILAPNGRLILAVPNRRGLWARAEAMPFGQGQPYSRAQLADMLRQIGFEFSEIYEIGHFLPHKHYHLTALSRLYSKIARHCFPYFGAVLLVEAQKRLYKPIMRPNPKLSPAFLPDFTPARVARLRQKRAE